MIFEKFQSEFKNAIHHYLVNGSPQTETVVSVIRKQKNQHYENDLKVIVDVIVRQILFPLASAEELNLNQLKLLVDLSIELSREQFCSVSLPIVILSELFDCRTLKECEELFFFIDDNVQVWKEDFFFKNVKNHLLRTCNDLLRRLSRNQNTVFCGRILIFLANFFPLFERSGLNLTSEFNQDNSTAYALQADGELSDNIHNVNPNNERSGDSNERKIEAKIDYNFYRKFWQLQEYFRNPATCYLKNNFKHFQHYCNAVLSVFSDYKIDPNSCFYFQTLGLDSGDEKEKNIFFAKFLTNQKLLELQLSDSNFRRHILIQILILFQYFTSVVKFRFENATLSEDQLSWINETKKKVNQLVVETPPNGEEMSKVIEHLLAREEFWNNWKNEGCAELTATALNETEGKQAEEYIRSTYSSHKRARIGDYVKSANNSNRILIGNAEMNRLWNFCPDNMEACKSQKREFTPSIEKYFEPALTSSSEERKLYCSEPNFSWKALRLLSQKSNYFFAPNNQVVRTVSEYLEGVVERLEKDYNIAASKSNSGSLETKAETEDISDDELLKNVDSNSVKSNDDDTLDAPDTNESNINETDPSDDTITGSIIDQVAAKIKDNWDDVCTLFGFQDDEVEYIKETNADPFIRMKSLLTIWKDDQKPKTATLKNLQKVIASAKLDVNLLDILSD